MDFPGGPVVPLLGAWVWLLVGEILYAIDVAKKISMYTSISIYKSWRNIQYLNDLEAKYSPVTDKN